jgi:hypothetical protein
MSIHTEVAVNELARLRHWIDLAVLQQLSAMISDLIGGFWFSPGSAIIVFDHPGANRSRWSLIRNNRPDSVTPSGRRIASMRTGG